MFLKINSIRSRLIFYCVALVLSSIFIVSSFFYFSLSHSWRNQDYSELLARTHYFHELFLKNNLRPNIVDGQLLVVIFRENKRIFEHFPLFLNPGFGKIAEVDINELQMIKKQNDSFLMKEGIKTLLLLDGDEDEAWEKIEVKLTQTLLDQDLKGLATFVDDDFFEIVTRRMRNGDIVAVGKFSEEREEKLADLRYLALTSFFPCLILTVLLSYFMSRSFLNPIEDLITLIKKIQDGEKNIRAQGSQRDDEVDLLKKEFNHLLDNNEKLVRSLKETLDNVAHDLKTPLTHFRMSAEAAMSNNDITKIKEALGEGIESSDLILRILKSLMDIQEVETGTLFLQKENFKLDLLVKDVIEMYSFLAEEKEIEIKSELSTLEIWADQSKVFQIISNLIDNAIKFSNHKSIVTVNLEKDNDNAIIRVMDEGIGMGPEEEAHIWERFYRSESSRHTRGAGIGLSLVCAYVKAHNGTVEVFSQEMKGSQFKVKLPLCNPAER